MATLNNVSSKLEKFMKEVYPSSADYKSKASTLKTAVSTSKSKYQSSLDDVASAWTSSDGAETKSILELIVGACSNIESSIDNDISKAIDDFDKVKEKYDEVEKLRTDNANLKPGENVQVSGLGVVVDFDGQWWDGKKYEKNDDDKIKKVNQQIDLANEQGDALIDAIKSSLDGVDLGIIGNMKRGGALGPVTSYELNTDAIAGLVVSFDEGESKPLNFWQECGCFLTGAVESVVKVGEGIVDFVLTLGAGAVSVVTGDDDNTLRQWAEYDVAGNTVGKLGEIIAGSEEAYENSVGRKIGDLTGSVIAHGALWAATGMAGPVLSALAIAGNRSENLLQEDKTVGEALWRGAALGTISLGVGKLAGAVTSKVAPALNGWVQNSSNIVAKTLKAATTSFHDIGTLSLGGKVVNVVASPLRGIAGAFNKTIQAGSKTVEKVFSHVPGHTLLQKVDVATTNLAQRAVDTVSNKVALTLNKSAVNNYNSALQNFKASGSKVNSPEYDAAQKAYNKLGANKPANFGDNAYTTQQIDSSIARYETSRAAWNSAGSPTSGSQYDAMMQKWNDIPQASRPSTLGQEAFTSAQKNIIGTPYETARSSWVSAGKPTSGAQYTAMQNEWNNLPAQLTNGASMGDAISPHAVNSLVNNYNNAVGLYYADQTAANKAAAQAAYNALPSSVKPAKLMDTALTTYRADALITDYQNAYVNWWNNGQQVHSAEYTAVENAYQKLGDLVRPPNVGDAVGNFTPTTPGTAGKFSGAITSTLMDESIN